MKHKKNHSMLSKSAPYLLTIYCIAVLLFFLAELKLFGLDEYLRATNQVLILFALLIMPFVIINMPSFIQSLTLKVSDKEFHVQLNELESNFTQTIGRVQQQVSTSEQSFWPILAGVDILAEKRLEGANPRIIIGAKNDPSQLFFTQLLALAITHENAHIVCDIRYPNGDSMHNFAELKYRWLDIYMDYTGTCIQYFNIHHKTTKNEIKSHATLTDELNQYGQELGIKWLPSLGCSEDYCLVMTPEFAESEEITSINDLKTKGGKLTFSADPEFMNRKDCLLGLLEYGVKFKSVLPCSVTDRYSAKESGEAEVFVGYESDPQVFNGEVTRLNDSEQFFPRYLAQPLVSDTVLRKIPGLEERLLLLKDCMQTNDLNEIVSRISYSNNDPQRAKAEAQRIFNNALEKHKLKESVK
ncbi:ABC transporter substrate-binding protein [Aliiglaciecola lipolytica]|uniref:Osmoprotectant transport system substrate-binding protein n=1 Tax=Aliiglaciecola lipolytica E3 TaxID=1127673 RepID=K6YSC4_9ALTE|nr:glycine betaine ABC transporter substrate-binding protein [Aliiglaciecola lipolytica]GAC14205.1 osmoprotectant transport system substrate-binding protein [Aliiglaciecola lipolytica E3]